MLGALLLITVLDMVSLELFFFLSLLGLLVVTHLTAPFNVTLEWRRRVQWLVVLGMAVFAYVVARRVLDVAGVLSVGVIS